MKHLKITKLDKMALPFELDDVILNDDELLVIRGGSSITPYSNGNCNCNCDCGTSNGNCNCNCSCPPTRED